MAEGRIEASLGVTDIISKVEAIGRVTRGAHGSTIKFNAALQGLDGVTTKGLDDALDSVFSMIEGIRRLEQEIDTLETKQIKFGLDRAEVKQLKELTGLKHGARFQENVPQFKKPRQGALEKAQNELKAAMSDKDEEQRGAKIRLIEKEISGKKDLMKADSDHNDMQEFFLSKTGKRVIEQGKKQEEFISRQVSAIKARIAAGKELTEVQKRFLSTTQEKGLRGQSMGRLGGSAQALALSELRKETSDLAKIEKQKAIDERNNNKEALQQIEAQRRTRKQAADQFKSDAVWRLKNGRELTTQQERLVRITKKMIDQNRVRASFRGVATAILAEEKKLAKNIPAGDDKIKQIEAERSRRKAAFEEFKADTVWRIRHGKELNEQQERLVQITKTMIEQNRVRASFRPVASAVLAEEKRLARLREKEAPKVKKVNIDQEKQIRDVVRAIKEKIRASDNLSDEELSLIRSTQMLVKENRTLTALQRKLAGALNLSANSVEFFDKKVKLANNSITSLKLLISRTRNAVLLFAFALRPMIRGLTEVVNKTIEYEKATTGLVTVAEKFGIRSNQVHEAIHQLTNDGLLKVTEASKGLRNLLSTGIGMDRAIKTMLKLKDAAAFNRQGMLGLGEAVVGATDGIKNMISRMVDNAGITKNISVILAEQAKIYGKQVSALTELEKHILIVEGLWKEADMFNGDAARLSDTLAGSFDKLSFSLDAFLRTLGGAIENKLGAFSGFANLITTMANSLTGAIEAIDQSPAVKAAIAQQRLGASQESQNKLDDIDRMAAASKASDAFMAESRKRKKIVDDLRATNDALQKEEFTTWEIFTGMLGASSGPLGVGTPSGFPNLDSVGTFGTQAKTLELQDWMGGRGENFMRRFRTEGDTASTPAEAAKKQHEIARQELKVFNWKLNEEKELLKKAALDAGAIGSEAYNKAVIEAARISDNLTAAMKPMQDALRDIMQNTKEVTQEIEKSADGSQKLTAKQVREQELWAAKRRADLERRTIGEEGGELKRLLDKEEGWFVEQVRVINEKANKVNNDGINELTDDRKKALLALVESQKKIRLKQIRDDYEMEEREDAKRIKDRLNKGLAKAEPTIWDRRKEAARLTADRAKVDIGKIELPEKTKIALGMTEAAVDEMLAKQLLQIDTERLNDAADKAAVLWVKKYNEALKREQKEASTALSALGISDIHDNLRQGFIDRLLGSDEKSTIDRRLENTEKIIQEKREGILAIQNQTDEKRKMMIDKIDTELLTAKDKHYKDLLDLYKDFLGKQRELDAELASSAFTLTEGLDQVSQAFGQVASAASFAGNAGIDGLDSIAKRGQLVAQSLSNVSNAVSQLGSIGAREVDGKATGNVGGLGSIAGLAAATGGTAAVIGAGLMMYQAYKGPGEGEKAKSRFNETGDLGSSISRGPNTININPSIIVQAEGDVLFSNDSIDVIRTRLIDEMQQAIDGNEITVEGTY